MNVEELWERFTPSARRCGRMKTCRFASAAIIPAIAIRAAAAVAATLPAPQTPPEPAKSWAALIASMVFLLPANLLPISIIYVNGARQDDTILSGIMSLASSNVAIAGVVFIASILVPFTKVIVLFTLLVSIQFKCEQGLRTRILLLRLITGSAAGLCWIFCHRINHVADQPRSAPRVYDGARRSLFWRRGNINYPCC